MSTTTTKGKNDSADTKGTTKAKKERKPRPEFDLTTAVDVDGKAIALDDKGRLTGIPANWNPRFAKLKRTQFTREAYFGWLISLEDLKIKVIQERKQEYADKRDGKVDEVAKKSKKAARMASQLAALSEELKAAGVDVAALLADA